MLFGGLAQLLAAVALAPFAQEVHHLCPAAGNPVGRNVAVGKAQHLNSLQQAVLESPRAYFAHRLLFAGGDARRGYLYTVYLGIHQQATGNQQLLVRHKVYTICLLTIPQGGVHYLYYWHFRFIFTAVANPPHIYYYATPP